MADISKIQIESGTYDIKDEIARNQIKLMDNLYLGAFFEEYDSNRIIIAVSKDSKNWIDIVRTEMSGRDPSIIYHDGYFYIAITHSASDHDFLIYKTADFITYTTNYVDMGFTSYHSRWAPEFFKDVDNSIKIILNVKETENDNFKNYISTIDLETFTTTIPVDITPDDELSTIDAQIIYDNNKYYLFVADQTPVNNNVSYSKTKIYESLTIGNWSIINSDVYKTFYFVEGACCLKSGNKFLIYADSPVLNPYLLIETSNLRVTDSLGEARDEIQKIGTLWDKRHGTIIYADGEEKEILYNIIKENHININFIENPPHMNKIISINNDTVTDLYIEENTIIYVNGAGGNIGKIWNPFRVKEFKIVFYANMDATLVVNKIQNVEGNTIDVNYTYANNSNLNTYVFTQPCVRTCSLSADYNIRNL